MVLVHHFPGWDEWYREATRKFAHHGYLTISPNLYERMGHATPEDMGAAARAAGGVPDDQAVGDMAASMRFVKSQAQSNRKVGVFGTCSGGRHAFLAACRAPGFDAIINCWGGRVVMSPEQLTANWPVAPVDYTPDLACPILGLFGLEDRSPTPEDVDILEAALKQHGKEYEFHRYANAGHGFFYYDRGAYRQEQTMDGWGKIWTFLGKHLISK